MRKTLLEITQIILSKMDSEEVNSIGDTTESLQVAQEVETTFYELAGGLSVPERNKLISFESLQEPTIRPNYLKTKEVVDNFQFVVYNIGTDEAPEHKTIKYVTPEDFLRMTMQTQGSSIMVVEDFDGARFTIKTDNHPTYYTMFNDTHLVFDSFNITVDDTLQESKAYGYGQVLPVFEMRDDYVPDLPTKYFPWLIAEAASMCFINHKQTPNSKEEQRAERQKKRQLNNLHRFTDEQFSRVNNYGRQR